MSAAEPVAAPPARAQFGMPEWMLLLCTLVWGSSFVLAKDAGEAINHAAGVGKHTLGPIVVLAIRFSLAATLMFVLLPAAHRGWTWPRVRDAAFAGGLLWAGITCQHVALDHTTEAVAAFLTSCAVIFVPVFMTIFVGQRPAPAAYFGIALAIPGIWLMSHGEAGDAAGAKVSLNFGVWLLLLGAALHAGHLIAVGRLSQRVGALRMCVGQFAVVGLASSAVVPFCAMRLTHFDFEVFHGSRIWIDICLLIAGPTFISFGLMARFQPRVSPVRAVMIYLFEPIAAAGFAWLLAGRTMTGWMVAGGTLVLIANAVVELLPVVAARKSDANKTTRQTTVQPNRGRNDFSV